MVIGNIPETYKRFVNVFLLTIAVNGFIKGLSHKDFNVKGGVNVLFFSVLNCWCGQSSKGPRGRTSLGVCWVNSQSKVEQVSYNFGCELLPILYNKKETCTLAMALV